MGLDKRIAERKSYQEGLQKRQKEAEEREKIAQEEREEEDKRELKVFRKSLTFKVMRCVLVCRYFLVRAVGVYVSECDIERSSCNAILSVSDTTLVAQGDNLASCCFNSNVYGLHYTLFYGIKT